LNLESGLNAGIHAILRNIFVGRLGEHRRMRVRFTTTVRPAPQIAITAADELGLRAERF
jgi:hypothetical protein